MSAKRDALANVSPAQTLRPAQRTANATGLGVEVLGFEEVEFCLDLGTFTDGTFAFDPEESDDNSTFTNIAAADLDGSFPVPSAANDEQIHRVGYKGAKRYVRVNLTASGTTTGAAMALVVQRRRPHFAPVA